MQAEELIEIFDSCWFESNIFYIRKPMLSNSAEPVPDVGQGKPAVNLGPMLSRVPTVLVRSMSEQLDLKTIFNPTGSVSPDSVLLDLPGGGKLKSIPSGKEASVEEGGGADMAEAVSVKVSHAKRKEMRRRLGWRGGPTTSKSLSELEFEEVKGFMDLGFVFSKEDKDSSLAEIIPGLHRLGADANEEQEDQSGSVSRPYLSESWEWWERRRKEEEERRKRRLQQSMQWEVPASGDRSDIKRSLRLWAHDVASFLR